ncbi:MAG: HAD family hydrolase, partial [Chloroflexi bacterium]|nr:HAD family hydrolase [Chloroflexota bacterium]
TEAVLFDLDDTLFDHQHSCRCGLAAVQKDVTSLAQVPLPTLQGRYNELLEELYPAVLRGEVTRSDALRIRFRRLLLEVGSGASEQDVAAASRCYWTVYRENRRPLPGAAALVHMLRPTVKVGVVTNGDLGDTDVKLRLCALGSVIGNVIASVQAGCQKPDSRIFCVALRHLGGVDSGRAVMVGDTWSTDVSGALAAGMRAVWLNRGGNMRPGRFPAVQGIRSFLPLSMVRALILGVRRQR